MPRTRVTKHKRKGTKGVKSHSRRVPEEKTVPHQSKYIFPMSEEQIIAEGVPYYHNLKKHATRNSTFLNIFPKEYDPEYGWHYPVVLQKTVGDQINRLDLRIKNNGKIDVDMRTILLDREEHPRTGRVYKRSRNVKWTDYKRKDVTNWNTVEKALNENFYLAW